MSDYQSYSDAALLDLVKEKNPNAFSALFDRYWENTYAHVLKMTGDEMEAKDIVQDTFASLWENAGKIRNYNNISGLLYIAAKNRVLNRFESLKTRERLIVSMAAFQENSQITVIDQMMGRELEDLINRTIEDLPAKMREIFIFSRKEELSHREIAKLLGISEATVKKQVQYALKIIRTRVDPRIFSLFFA